MTPAADLVRQEIERRGPMDFARFVDLALYHPDHGYYSQSTPRRGKTGDYFTSMQVSGLFPKIFAEAILQLKETLASEQFSLIEIGAGGGEFLEAVLQHVKPNSMKVWAVERSRPARDALRKRLSRFPRCEVVASFDEIEWMGSLEGCIFSNELFDALPFHRLKWRGGEWREVMVDLVNGNLIEKEGKAKVENGNWKIEIGDLTDGHEITWRPDVPSLYEEWGARLSRGYVLTVDYGHPREAFFSPTRANGAWLCYHKHQANKTPFENIGAQDITAHVDFTQLVEAGGSHGFDPGLFCSQGIFLSHVGQKHIEAWLSTASESERRSRAAAIQQLIHPDAMGEAFWVLLQSKGVEIPASFAVMPNRLRRLV